eukprot:TRINITY_DN1981_c0_g1_i1.p1 TRINITY_DN1981_c0_g1~~TRINITY_DN1981_c0_g1_i1.p1  ORF type:complete len:683 (-),score=28.15 TRINITY_DN1981_c0_g1_i1:30-2078(-)
MMMMRKMIVLLVVVLAFVCSSSFAFEQEALATCPTTVDCSQYTSCTTCTSSPPSGSYCGWCGTSGTCMNATAGGSVCTGSCGVSGCFKTSSTYCPTVSECSTLTSCNDCTKAQCAWCGQSHKCEESSSSGLTPCSGDACSVCWKSTDTYCPAVPDCSTLDNCADCANAQCAWCGNTRTCSEVSSSGLTPCSGDSCKQCFKTTDTYCPEVKDCSTIHNCTACADAQCYWCGATSTCSEGSSSGLTPCSGDSCSQCWKGTTTYCPAVANCSTITSCSECTNEGCAWCGSSRTCIESSSSGLTPCKGPACNVCWKTTDTYCPEVEDCTSLTNCSSCTNEGCYWCGQTQTCREGSSSGLTPCVGSACDVCWKTTDTYCPVANCSTISNCRDCTASSMCGWCDDTQQCMEASSSGATPCQGLCNVWAFEDCAMVCAKKYPNCTSCNTQNDPVGCGWCSGALVNGSPLTTPSYCALTVSATDRSQPSPNHYKCSTWTPEVCPDCSTFGDCALCTSNSACGWVTTISQTGSNLNSSCVEGNEKFPFMKTVGLIVRSYDYGQCSVSVPQCNPLSSSCDQCIGTPGCVFCSPTQACVPGNATNLYVPVSSCFTLQKQTCSPSTASGGSSDSGFSFFTAGHTVSSSTTTTGGSSHIGAIVGGVVGGVAFVALVAGGVWFYIRRRSRMAYQNI